MVFLGLGILTVAIWVGLWLGRAAFWRVEFDPVPPDPEEWPPVTAVIPARNEEATLPKALRSLWEQDYPGGLRVVVVDDQSEDRTAAAAQEMARAMGRADDLLLLTAAPLPPGWVGKVWAMHSGLTHGIPAADPARYVLLCDADISHGAGTLRELVARAEGEHLDLASVMVRLECRTPPEQFMIPAFVWFFRLLYPFRKVNDPREPLAGAAGGTMLLRREALARIGGLQSIRSAIIDDCALAAAVKAGGHPIWLGLSAASRSTRGYGSLREIVDMIARTAYTQLGYSPARLVGCVFGLGLTFLGPCALAIGARGASGLLGAAAWALMALLYAPMLRLYGQSLLWAPLLPLTACVYLYATLLSAWRHHRGRGGQWKGRQYGDAAS